MKLAYYLFIVCGLVFASCGDSSDDIVTGPGDPGDQGPVTFGNSFNVINDNFDGTPVVIAGNRNAQIMVSFDRTLSDGSVIQASRLEGAIFPQAFTDNNGNIWDVNGKALSGPNTGESLNIIRAVNTYWFAVSASFPGIDVYTLGPLSSAPPLSSGNNDWLVPSNFIFQGSAEDFIPSIDNPKFDEFEPRDLIEDYSYLSDNELVSVVDYNGVVKVYPHSILSYHEIVNDELIDGQKFSMLFCPLIGSSSAWSRTINGQEVTYGVSGLLYNNDLIAFDRASGSRYLQLTGECINGPDMGRMADQVRFFETSWGALRSLYLDQNIFVLSDNTDQGYDYSSFPYTNYKENDDFIYYPLTFEDTRLDNKERVHALFSIQNQEAKVYRLADF